MIDEVDTPPEPGDETADETAEANDEKPDTFPREYVETLRKESAGYRERVKAAEANSNQIAQRLHVELVRATGLLADPTDLPFDAAHLDDNDQLTAAIEKLIESKPHLKARKIAGHVGQGPTSEPTPVNLLAMLRQRV
ncbi:MAG: hypothetical protein AB7G47_21435 [Mycolicibacterium sp.]|uniref:hypothetical protein n=1 Tax=Mycolicibacterium sp. TaxID=2320850 RepID=UPI003D0E8222